jgi:hypothetical protein
MSKNTEIKLVGQPIFSQVLKLVDKWEFSKLVGKHKSDHYYQRPTSLASNVSSSL